MNHAYLEVRDVVHGNFEVETHGSDLFPRVRGGSGAEGNVHRYGLFRCSRKLFDLPDHFLVCGTVLGLLPHGVRRQTGGHAGGVAGNRNANGHVGTVMGLRDIGTHTERQIDLANRGSQQHTAHTGRGAVVQVQ